MSNDFKNLLAVGLLEQLLTVNDNTNCKIGNQKAEMIKNFGYPVEEFQKVKTEDGYLLTMHRIPWGKHDKNRENRPVVFLMHGLLSSAVDWVNMGPGFSIVYDLVEAGYDVWMGNARGTKMSRSHERLHPVLNNKKFWAFSWHEIGYYDLPAMIDFVLLMTHKKKLNYIGHSQGTTCFFAMASTRPEYNRKIKLMVALAPVVYMKHTWNPMVQFVAKFHPSVSYISNLIGWHEFLPGEKLFNLIGRKVCNTMALIRALCTYGFFLVCGWDSKQFNKAKIPLIIANVPAGASSRQFLHYGQLITSGQFQQYDFGKFENFITYHTVAPPLYNLKRITAPVSLIYAENDWLSAIQDVERLQMNLRNVVDSYRVPYKHFNHLDYVFAIDLKKLVNDHVVETLDRFNK